MTSRGATAGRYWWIPAGLAAALGVWIFGAGSWSLAGESPYTRYKFAGTLRRFTSLRGEVGDVVVPAALASLAMIVLATVATVMACHYFRTHYQNRWIRSHAPALAAGAVAAGVADFAANLLIIANDRWPSDTIETLVAGLSWMALPLYLAAWLYVGLGIVFWLARACGRLAWRIPGTGTRTTRALLPQPLPAPSFGDGDLHLVNRPPPSRPTPAVTVASSGGGIRSAVFSLGALQALSEADALPPDATLCAVSGGSWMAAGFAGARTTSDTAFSADSAEAAHLRANAEFLAPDFLAKVALVTRVLAGTVLNVVFLGSILLALSIPWGWLIGSKYLYPGIVEGRQPIEREAAALEDAARDLIELTDGDTGDLPPDIATAALRLDRAGRELAAATEVYQIDGVDASVTAAAARATELREAVSASLDSGEPIVGLAEAAAALADDAADIGRFARRSAEGRVPISGGLLAISLSALVGLVAGLSRIGGASNHASSRTSQKFSVLVLSVAGFLAATLVVLPWVLSIGVGELLGRAGGLVVGFEAVGTVILGATAIKTLFDRQVGRIALWLAGLVAPLMVGLAVLLSVRIGAATDVPLGWIAAAVAVYGVLMSWGDVNAWSLHPWYSSQLAKAFGSATTDGRRRSLTRSESSIARFKDPATPTPVICAAVNLSESGVSTSGMRASSFMFSPATVGVPDAALIEAGSENEWTMNLGTKTVDATIIPRLRYTTLFDASAISGAAVSPAMGKMTRTTLRALLAVANLRLGVWMPNPVWVRTLARTNGDAVWREPPRPTYLLREIFGSYRVDDRFLYVTDGGHWENLALVEALRRRSKLIFCFDASGDSIDRFKTLSEAVALARIELGIEIGQIDPYDQQSIADPDSDEMTAVARAPANFTVLDFDYPDDQPGRIIYCRAVVTDSSPIDVREYQQARPSFPADSTLDQLFDHEQFEAYRQLGYAAGTSAALIARN